MTQKEFSQRVVKRAKRAGLTVSSSLLERLWTYFDLLFRWNVKINLTSLSLDSPDEAVDRLLIEPVAAARQVLLTDRRMIDVGSGGGSPAIPMSLAAPHLRLVMVESKSRKSAFLREVLRQLGITGTVETARFEELLTRADFHESFDILTLRAVRVDGRALGTLQAFVRPGGRLLLFRRAPATNEKAWLAPPLRWMGTSPLLAGTSLSAASELAVLEKLRIP